MSSLTLDTSQAEHARLKAALVVARRVLGTLGQTSTLHDMPALPDPITALWHAAEDAAEDLRGRLESLETDWDTRHWDAADWRSSRLVARNID